MPYHQPWRPQREPSPFPRYVVNALVPDPLGADLEMLRKRLDRWSNQWLPPHLTIVPPFNADLTDGQRHQIAAHAFPLEMELMEVGTFRQRHTSTVWYGVKARGLIARMNEFYADMPWLKPFADQRPIQPHVTVASRIPHHELTYVETAASAAKVVGEAKIERLSLFRWDDAAGRWVPGV